MGLLWRMYLAHKTKIQHERDELLYEELVQAAREIEPYYDIDKIKSYSVYIWTKTGGLDGEGENVFDIVENEIIFYVEDHIIPEEVLPIIQNIQSKIKAIRLNWEE